MTDASRAAAREDKHQIDPTTGGCTACGATRENVDDCQPRICPADGVTPGPHRIAILAARWEMSRRQDEIEVLSKERRRADDVLATAQERSANLDGIIAGKQDELAELDASIECLRGDHAFDVAALARLRTTSGGYGT